MLTGLTRQIASFGAGSTFEKARLSATFKGDTEPPNEQDIQSMLYTLSGKDPETRPQIAYTTILQKLESSQSKNRWNYIVKNLVILDRCVDERFFVQDIQNLRIAHVENYQEKDLHYKGKCIEELIKTYFRFIKVKALFYSKKNTSFNMSREEVKEYFAAQSASQIFDEVIMAQKLHDLIIEISNTTKKGLLKYHINQYVFLLLLLALAQSYSMQYKAILSLIEKLFTMNLQEAQTLKDTYTRFLKQNEELIFFANSYKFVQGFGQINLTDYSRTDPRVVASIVEYMQYLNGQSQGGLPEEITFDDEQQLIFDGVEESLRKSLKVFNGEQVPVTKIKEKEKIEQPKLIAYEQKLKDLNLDIFEEEAFTKFDIGIFMIFQNNYSTSYVSIEQKFIHQHDLKEQEKSPYGHIIGSSPGRSNRITSHSNHSPTRNNLITKKPNIIEYQETIMSEGNMMTVTYESEYDQMIFLSFINNYSTEYREICNEFKNLSDQVVQDNNNENEQTKEDNIGEDDFDDFFDQSVQEDNQID